MQCRHAHWARLARRGDDRAFEENIAHRSAGFANRVHLGVSRDVGRQYYRVVRTRQNLAIAGDGAAKRTLPQVKSVAALFDRQTHQIRWIHVFDCQLIDVNPVTIILYAE